MLAWLMPMVTAPCLCSPHQILIHASRCPTPKFLLVVGFHAQVIIKIDTTRNKALHDGLLVTF
jgi:hypothetical protein